jgi:molybdopterin-guanine dinucleotide biosynthesis protein
MARYNRATETMIDLACDDLERYDATTIEGFKNEVIKDHGMSDDDIETRFANGYSTDAICAVAVKAFMSLVNWGQVATKYRSFKAKGGGA